MKKYGCRYFKLVEAQAKQSPCLQYFRFSRDGRLLECISYYSPGATATKKLPLVKRVTAAHLYRTLGLEPENLDEFEQEWDGGYTVEISRDDFKQALEEAVKSE